jgi:hypothetical protein
MKTDVFFEFQHIRQQLAELLWHCRPRKLIKRFVVTQVRESKTGFTTKGKIMSLTMTDVQSSTLTVTVEDSAGVAAAAGGVPVWTVAPAGAVVLAPAADGLSCVVSNASPPVIGASVVTVTGNGALPDGTADPADVITATEGVTITSGEASQFAITASTPTP